MFGEDALLEEIDEREAGECADAELYEVPAGEAFAITFGTNLAHLSAPSQLISYDGAPKGWSFQFERSQSF